MNSDTGFQTPYIHGWVGLFEQLTCLDFNAPGRAACKRNYAAFSQFLSWLTDLCQESGLFQAENCQLLYMRE